MILTTMSPSIEKKKKRHTFFLAQQKVFGVKAKVFNFE